MPEVLTEPVTVVLRTGVVQTADILDQVPTQQAASQFVHACQWGIWHLPVAFVALGIFTIPYLVFVHATIGYFLVTSWRRTGNLAAPGVAHAVIDGLRNGVAVL